MSCSADRIWPDRQLLSLSEQRARLGQFTETNVQRGVHQRVRAKPTAQGCASGTYFWTSLNGSIAPLTGPFNATSASFYGQAPGTAQAQGEIYSSYCGFISTGTLNVQVCPHITNFTQTYQAKVLMAPRLGTTLGHLAPANYRTAPVAQSERAFIIREQTTRINGHRRWSRVLSTQPSYPKVEQTAFS